MLSYVLQFYISLKTGSEIPRVSLQTQDPCQDYCKYEGATTWNLDANCKGCGASMAEAKSDILEFAEASLHVRMKRDT